MRQLTALDSFFLALEGDRNYGHVGSLAVLDPTEAPGGALDVDRVRALISKRLHLVPPFTQRLARVPLGVDYPYWVEDERFDIAFHVRETALPAPGSMEQLVEVAGRIYSRRLDPTRPLWELYVIQGLEGGRVAMLNKVHHAAVDGLSGAEILGAIYDLTPEPRAVPAPGPADAAAGRGAASMLAHAAARAPRGILGAGRRAFRLLRRVDAPVSMLIPAVRAPRGVFDAPLSAYRTFGIGSLSLTDVKLVKNQFGVKVNDVVTALVAGAVREHLLAQGRLPDRSLIAQIPVSVRTDQERGAFGNEVSIMLSSIETAIEDPVARLLAIRDRLAATKALHDALPAKALREAAQLMPAAVHARAAKAMVELAPRAGLQPPFNLVISNVPGPPVDLYAAGARLEALYPLSIIMEGAGLNVTVMSYRDSIDIGITADREQTPDVQDVVVGMQRELALLLTAAGDDALAGSEKASVAVGNGR